MSADRNLLFGLLAVQLDFVSHDELTAGLNVWLADKSKPLGDVLRDLGHLPPGRLQLLDALVAEHLHRHGDDVRRSLAALSSVEPALRRTLDALADDEVQRTLHQLHPPGEPRPSGSEPPPGVRYRILRPHAKGGLGEVYVAEDTELGRSVALKEIQGRYADDDASRARFVREAEITGGLEHPGVVPVYGLGTYSDGRPFYAMRFIQGDTFKDAIKRYHAPPSGGRQPPETSESQGADAPRSAGFASLQFRDLLRRFIDVCNAVAYAHSRGVLHRDLKPGNVMLGQYGETLVVDWGLAKATGRAGNVSDRSDEPLHPRSGDSSATVAGQALGTPAYMSPEQAAGQLDSLGPATDVYSLGATLYEALTGRAPFGGTSFAELLDAVKSGRFPPPRTVQPAVPSALDAVCQKCMALRPAERYASPLDVAKEVERFLADEPVAAYPEPAAARARRWVRKHARLATGVGVALAVGVAGLGVGAALLAAAERRERAERVAKEAALAHAEQERDRALAARATARQALDEMVSGATGESLTTQKAVSAEQAKFLREVLKYYEQFAAEPGEDRLGRVRLAKAHARLGAIRYRLGQREDGAAVLRRAAELYAGLAAEFPAVPDYRRDLAHTRHGLGVLLVGLGRRAEAETAFRAAAGAYERLATESPEMPGDRREAARSHTNLGMVLAGLSRTAEAEAAFRAALAVQERLAAEFPAVADYRAELAFTHQGLGVLFDSLGRRAEAEAAHGAALVVRERLAAEFPAVPDYRVDLARSHQGLGVLFAGLGRAAEAEAAFRASLAVRERLAADYPAVPDYRAELARSHNNLGLLFASLGRTAEAEAAYRAAVAVQGKLADDFPAVPDYRRELARSQSNLGALLAGLGRQADAEAAIAAALAVRERLATEFPTVPDYRRDLAASHNNRGALLARLGKRAEAEAAYRAALAVQERLAADYPAVPDCRGELAQTHTNLGLLLASHGKDVEAEAAYRAALSLNDTLASDHPDVPRYRENRNGTALALSLLLVNGGRWTEAVATVDRVAAGPAPSADRLYDCACVCAVASAAANNPAAAAHAARAVELLRRAIAAGYRDVPHLLADTDLASLRRRDDYAALLWDLADASGAEKR